MGKDEKRERHLYSISEDIFDVIEPKYIFDDRDIPLYFSEHNMPDNLWRDKYLIESILKLSIEYDKREISDNEFNDKMYNENFKD